MSTVIIIGSGGGGHKAITFLKTHYKSMKADKQAVAVEVLRQFVDSVNIEFDQDFSTTEL